jgi:hypothetical protein
MCCLLLQGDGIIAGLTTVTQGGNGYEVDYKEHSQSQPQNFIHMKGPN